MTAKTPPASEAPPISTPVRVTAMVLGALLYVGALLLGWLADAPGEVVEPMKGLAYAIALLSPSVVGAVATLGKSAKP